MFRIFKHTFYSVAALIFGLSLTSCKSKTREANKQDLLEAIEHYNIDPVDTVGKEPLGTAEVNDILCHYPELYHATEKAQKLYVKWAETEQEMIATVFVGKGKSRVAKAAKGKQELAKVIDERSITKMMDYVLLGADNLEEEELSTDEATADLYMKIMASVLDGQTANKDHAATDEMKSAVGYARRAWKDYLAELHHIIGTVPASARARYIKAVNDMVRFHYIDLLNRYYSYYENENPGWLLPYNATDDAIENFTFQGFHDRDWMEAE